MIAPFFADVDTRVGNVAEFGTGLLDGHRVFVVNWPGVGCYDENDSVTNDFQLILIDRPDLGTGSLGDDFQVEYNYGSIQWDAGQASDGDATCNNAPNPDSAIVGFSDGTSTVGHTFQLNGSQSSGAFLDGNAGTGLVNNDLNTSTLGRYLFTFNGGTPTLPTTPSSLSGSTTSGGQTGSTISTGADTPVVDQASLTGANSGTAGGTVSYNVYSDSNCSDLFENAGTFDVTDGYFPPSNPVSFSSLGTYYWQVSYSGDGVNEPATSSCGSEITNVVPPAPTSLSTTLTADEQSGSTVSVGIGTYVSDQATLSGTNSATAGGTITYNVYSDPNCSDLFASGGTSDLSDGYVPPSDPVDFPSLGTFYWQVSYGGDGLDEPSSSSCGSEITNVISPTPTSLSTSLSSGAQSGSSLTVQINTPVGDQATLSGSNSGTASGTITYDVYSDRDCTDLVADGGTWGVFDGYVEPSEAVSFASPGTYYWQASYSGDELNAASHSSCGSEITKAVVPSPAITRFTPTSGTPGATVSITGSHLSGAIRVTFNGKSGAISSDSSTVIKALVPVGATTGKIAVTTPGGTATSATKFTAERAKAPTITRFTPTSGPKGTTVTVTGANLYGAKVTFNGKTGSIVTDASTSIKVKVPSGATTGKIKVTTAGGSATSSSSFRVT